MHKRRFQQDVPATPAAKDDVLELLSNLPDGVSLEDIQYHLHVLEGIRRGQEDIRAGRQATHAQAREGLNRWLGT